MIGLLNTLQNLDSLLHKVLCDKLKMNYCDLGIFGSGSLMNFMLKQAKVP